MSEKPENWPKKWQRKRWMTQDGDVHELTLLAAYEAICSAPGDKSKISEVFGVPSLSDRRVDRALTLLKKAKLIQFVRGTGWVAQKT